MREYLGFLKVTSVILKTLAWVFLALGFISGTSILFGFLREYPRMMGLAMIIGYAFPFFIFIVIAKIEDVLIRIIETIN